MHNLESYKSDHLFLLIGSNPLPNYVAAILLGHSHATKLYLIHTTDVEGIACNLQRSLAWPDDRLQFIPVDDANANDIFGKVKAEAAGKNNIGLHYTGGTKAMAVHAYRAIQSVDPQAVFSYLNARNLKLLIDQAERQSVEYPVGMDVKLEIKDLLGLHGYHLKDEPQTEPFLPDFCRDMLKVPYEELRNWCNNHLRTSKGLKTTGKLRKEVLPTNEPFAPIQDYWNGCITLNDLANKWSMKDAKEVAEFIDGKWLEHYVLWSVQQVKSAGNIHQSVLNINPKERHREFEFDVAAMRGYQLFGFSCSTIKPSKGNIKQKLFEAYLRVRQMGGDEARVAFVGFTPNKSDNNPRLIEQDIEEQWEGQKNKIRVFGAEHLPDLAQHLETWFNIQ